MKARTFSEKTAEKIVACMAICGNDRTIQKKQTLHRLRLIRRWGVKRGSRVLEIGCGQGDTTAALAEIVGDDGFVLGIDSAPPDYGAPITLGDAAAHLAGTRLGGRIRIEFSTPLPKKEFPRGEAFFDYAVLSHCAWYFSGAEELRECFGKLRACARRICFAEWDAVPRKNSQIAHALAALVQAQCGIFKTENAANIRALLTPDAYREIAAETGWEIEKTFRVPAPDLDDARWEIAEAFSQIDAAGAEDVPEKLRTLLRAEAEILRRRERACPPQCLDVFGMVLKNPDAFPRNAKPKFR